MPAGVWQDYQGNDATLVSQVLSFGRLHLRPWLGPEQPCVVSPYKTSMLASMATFYVHLARTAVARDR